MYINVHSGRLRIKLLTARISFQQRNLENAKKNLNTESTTGSRFAHYTKDGNYTSQAGSRSGPPSSFFPTRRPQADANLVLSFELLSLFFFYFYT